MIPSDSPLSRIRQRSRRVITPPGSTTSERGSAPLSRWEAEQLALLLNKPVDFVESDAFGRRGAETRIYGAEEIARPDVSWYRPLMDNLTPTTSRTARPTKAAVLTGDQERVLFLKYNYARFRVRELQNTLGTKRPSQKIAREMLRWHGIALRYRHQLAETNLALVLAMAKRTRMSEVDFADLVSEGNMALLRAIDKFDCGRGFKFSTYGCRAILKAFSRHGMRFIKYRQRFPAEYDEMFERSDHLETIRAQHLADSAAEVRHLVIENTAELSGIERTVIHHRFGVDGPSNHKNLTLEQVGQIIGVTKERVRQIQNKALQKLREVLSEPSRGAIAPRTN